MNHLKLQTKYNDISYELEKCKDTEKKLSQEITDAILARTDIQKRIDKLDLLRSKTMTEKVKLEKELDDLNSIECNFYAGAVFKHPTGSRNPFLLVAVTYKDNNMGVEMYQLLGFGVASNSGCFHEKVHTKEECVMELLRYRMVYGGNINPDITKLVTNISSNVRGGINKY